MLYNYSYKCGFSTRSYVEWMLSDPCYEVNIGTEMVDQKSTGELPSFRPDGDEIRRRQAAVAAERMQKPEPSRATEKSRSGSGAGWLAGLLVLVLGGAVVYLALQQYSTLQLIASYEERLDLADDRIVSLERSLTQTDESVAMNGTAINAQFQAIKSETDLQMSEIRKLWDVANKRNREWIEENQAALIDQSETLAALNDQLATVDASLESFSAGQNRDAEALEDLTTQLANERIVLSDIGQSIDSVRSDVDTMQQELGSIMDSDLEAQLISLTLTQENLLAEQGELADGVSDSTADIAEIREILEAVDASRLETSRRLTAMASQIDRLEARITELTGGAQ